MKVAAELRNPANGISRFQHERQLYLRATMMQFVVSALLSFALMQDLSVERTLTWLAVLWTTLAARALYIARMEFGEEPDFWAAWERKMAVAAFITGAAWGSSTLLLIGVEAKIADEAIVFGCAGIAAASVGVFASNSRASFAVVFATFAPVVVMNLLKGGTEHLAFAGVALLYMVSLIFAARGIARIATSAIESQGRAAVLSLRLEKEAQQRHFDSEQAQLRALTMEMEHESRYAELFANFNDYILFLDLVPGDRFVVASMNPAAEQVFGVDPAAGYGQSLASYLPAAFAARLETSARESATSGARIRYEDALATAFGSRTLGITLTAMRNHDGRVYRLAVIANDITDQKRAEQVLRERAEQEARLSAFISSVPGYLFSLRLSSGNQPASTLLFVSDGVRDVFGVAREEATLERIVAQCHPEDAAKLSAALVAAADTLAPVRVELRISHPERGERWIETYAQPTRESDGSMLWNGVVQDITERKQAQERMEQLDHAINCASDSVFLIGEDLNIRYVNDAACRGLGYSREELLTMTPVDIDPNFTPESIEGLVEALKRSQKISIESHHRAKDGRVYPIELDIVSVNFGGRGFYLATTRDISERRRMQEALAKRERDFRTLAENAPDNIFRYDSEGRILYANAQVLKALGRSLDQIAGVRPAAHYPEIYGELEAKLLRVLETGKPDSLHLLLPTPAGEFHHHINIAPEFDDNGVVTGALAFGRDITELHRQQQRANMLEYALDRMHDAAYLIDTTGEVLYVNEAAVNELGYSRDELQSMSAFDFDPLLTKEKGDKLNEALAQFGSVKVESQHQRRNGECFPVELTLSPSLPFNGLETIMVIARNLTRQKADESALAQQAAELRERADFQQELLKGISAAGLYVLVEENRKIIYATHNENSVLDLGPVAGSDLRVERDVVELIHPDDRAKNADYYRRRLAGEPVPSQYEIGVVGRNGERLEFELNVSVIPGTNPPRTLTVAKDITERKRFEATLLESAELERRQSQFFATAPGVYSTGVLSPDGTLRLPFVSEGMRDLYGVDPEAVMKDVGAMFARLYPGEAAMLTEIMGKSARDLTPFRAEYRIDHPQKGLRWIEVNALPQRLDDGGTRWDGVYLDVTERKQMEQALAKQEREFRSLSENLPDNVVRWDAQCRYTYLNPTTERSIRASCAEVVGKRPSEAFPDGRFAVLEAGIEQVLASGEAIAALRQTVPMADGSVRIHELKLVPERDEAGRVVGVLGLGRDMTEIYSLQEAVAARERQFRSLAETTPDPIFRYATDGTRLYVNPAVERIFGKKADYVLGGKPADLRLLDAQNAPILADGIRRVGENGEIVTIDVQFTNGIGERRDLQMLMVPERDENGAITSVLALGRDTTSLRDTERRMGRFIEGFPGFAFTAQRAPSGKTCFPFASSGIAHLYGVSPDEVKDDIAALDALVHPDDIATIAQSIGQMLKTMSSTVFRYRICKPDASVRWLECYGTPERVSDGSMQWHGIVLDVTERMAAVEQLREALQFNEGIINAIPDLLFEVDRDGRYLSVWAGAPTLLAAPKESLIGKTIRDVLPLEAADRCMAALAEADANGVSFGTEYHLPLPAGDAWFEGSIARKAGGDPAQPRFIAIVRDITERKRMEAQLLAREREFRGLTENLPDNVVRWDAQCRYAYLNPTTERTVCATSAELLGKRPSEAFPDGRFAALEAAIEQVLATGESILSLRQTVPTADGSPRIHELNLVAERNETGRIIGVLGLGRDMTDVYALQEAAATRERQFRTLAENSPDPIFRYDREGRRIYANPAVAKFVGENRIASLLNRAPEANAVLNGDDAAKVNAALHSVIETGESRRVEVRLVDAKGEPHVHETLLVAERNAAGEIETVLGLSRDVTRIRENERRLTRFVERLPGFAFTAKLAADGKMSIPFASPGITTLFGLRPSEVKDDFAPLLALTHPDDVLRIESVIDEMAQTLIPMPFEFRVGRIGEPARWIEVFVTPERDADGGTLWHGIMLDITERKQAEEKLHDALEFNEGVISAIPDVLIETDRNGRYINVWAHDHDLLTAEKQHLIGRTVHDIMPPDAASTVMAAFEEADVTGVSFGKTIRLPLAMGERWFELSVAKKAANQDGMERFITLSRDVTERMRTQQQLELLNHAINRSNDAVYLMAGDEARFIYVNDAACRALGYSREELLSMSVIDIDPSTSAGAVADMFQVVTGGENIFVESHHRTKDGRDIPVELSISPVELGEKRTTLAVARDLTERKRAMRELEMLNRAINQSNDAVFLHTRASGSLYVNDQACRMLGYSREELLAMPIEALDPDLDAAREEEIVRAVAAGNGYAVVEARHRAKDGRIIPVEISISASADRDMPILSVVRDITERKRAQRELELLNRAMNQSSDAIYLNPTDTELGNNFVYVNDEACRMLGYSREELLGMSVFDIDPTVTLEALNAIDVDWRNGGKMVFETAHRSKDGRLIPVEISATAIFDEGRQLNLAVVRDISERKRVQRELEMLNRAINHSNDAIFLNDRNLGIIYANDEACRSLGYSREELLGKTIKEINPFFSGDELAELRKRAAESGGHAVFESRHQAKDGRVFPVEISASLSLDGSLPTLTVIRDITERKRMEEILRERLDFQQELLKGMAASGSIVLVIENQKIIYATQSKGMPVTFGASSWNSLIEPRPFIDIVHPDDKARVADLHARRLRGEAVPDHYEIAIIGDDGNRHDLELALATLPGTNPVRTLVVGRDITERKRVENTLRFMANPDTADGEGFLHALACHLNRELGVRHVVIGKLAEQDGWIETVALCAGGTIAPNMQYALSGAPCENVVSKEACFYPSGVQALFPADALLVEMGAEGYAGTPLWDSAGNPLGLIAVLSDAPLGDELSLMRLLQLVAPRVAMELERDRMEAALRASRESLNEAQRISHVGNWELDLVSGDLHWSDEIFRIFEIDPAQFDASYEAFLNAIHPEDREMVSEAYTNSLKDRAPYAIEHRLLFADGRIKYVHERCESFFAADGKPLRSVGTVQDITESKRAQQEVEMLTQAMNQQTDAAFLIAGDGTYLYVNDAACRMLGYSREELLALSVLDIGPNTTPEQVAGFHQRLVDGDSFHFESRHRRKDGSEYPVELSVSGVRYDGTILGLVIGRDITERKRIQQQVEMLTHAMNQQSDAAFIADEEFRYVYVNEAACRLFGYSRDEMLAMTPRDFDPEFTPEKAKAFREKMKAGEVFSFEAQRRRKDGMPLDVEISLGVITYGGVTLSLTVVRDIAERKRAQAALQASELLARSRSNLLNAIMESSPELIVFALDAGYRYLAFNSRHSETMSAIWGKEIETGMNMLEVISLSEDRDTAKRGFDRALSGESFVEENMYGDEARAREYWQNFYSPIRSESGEVMGLTCFVVNISHRKRLEVALARREREFRSLAENMPDNVARFDLDGRYLYINPTHERVLGKLNEEVVGTLLPEAHAQVRAAVAQVAADGKAIHAVRQQVVVNGEIQWHDVSVVPELDEQGRVVSVLGMGRDMTNILRMQEAVVQREREFRSLAENSPDAIYRYDGHGSLIFANETAERLTGVPRGEISGGTSEDALRAQQCIRSVLDGNGPCELELAFVVADGREVVIHHIFVPEFNEAGSVQSVLSIGRDITERKRAQAQLELLNHAINQSNDAVYLCDQDLRFTYVNDAACRTLGYSREELLAMGPAEIDLNTDRDEAKTVMNFAQEAALPIIYESVHRTRDGRERQVEVSSSIISHQDAIFGLTVARDITERKATENRLATIRTRLESVMRTIPDLVWLKDVNGTYLACNHGFESLIGITEEQLVGQTDYDVFDKDLADFFREKDREAIAAGNVVINEEWVTFASDGRYALLETRKVPVYSDDGVLTGVLGVGREITERHQMEAEIRGTRDFLQSVINGFPDPMMVKDREHRWVMTNDAMCKLMGRPREALLGKTELELLPNKAQAEGYRATDELVFEHERILVGEESHVYPDGTPVHLQTTRTRFADQNGKLFMISVVRDITERKKMELEIRDARDFLQMVINGVSDPLLVKDRDHRWLLMNDSMCALLQRPREDLIGKSDYDYMPQEQADLYWQMDDLVFTAEPVHVNEEAVTSADGTTSYFQTKKTRIVGGDGKLYLVGVLRDITERKQMEELLARREQYQRTLLDNFPFFVWLKDENSTLLAANKEYARVANLSSPLELEGMSDYDIFPQDLAEKYVTDDRAVMASGVQKNVEEMYTDEHGVRRWMETWKAPVVVNGRTVGTVGFSRDITERRHMEELLAARERELRTLVANMPDVVVRYDVECRRIFVSPVYETVTGLPVSTVLGKRPVEAWGPPTMAPSVFESRLREVMTTGRSGEVTLEWWDKEGRHMVQLLSVVPEFDGEGRVTSVLTVARDVSDLKRAEALLYAREEAFRSLAENTPDTIARYDRDFRRLYGNPALVKQTGVPAHQLIGRTVDEFPGGEPAKVYAQHMQTVFASGEESGFEMNWKSVDGTDHCTHIRIVPERDRSGAVVSVLAVGRDITEIDGYRRRIFSLAFYDPMTGLANRALFNDRMHQTLSDAEWHKRIAGLMLIDLDRFKNINDSLGHAVGDELLREAGARLSQSVRSYDTVARLGGDEYAVLLPEIRNADDAGTIANKILNALSAPFMIEGRELFVSASVGVALYPDDGANGDELLKYADSAMYHAKARGRNNFQFYRSEMTARAGERLELEAYLRRALGNGEFSLHYQPQVALEHGRVIGAEALLRWRNAELGNITPDRFIGIAEDTGMIVEIGEWVLQEACRTAAKWNRSGHPIRVAVNLSTRQFRSKKLVDTVLSALHDAECRPEWIELEITESLLLEENMEVREIMDELRANGLVFAIDDFGTGYSALGYLRRFPIETIKIDRSFVNGITSDSHSAALVRAIISMTEVLQLSLVAEGVETQEQCDLLREWGANHHVAQGYFFGRPMPRVEFEQKLLGTDADESAGTRH